MAGSTSTNFVNMIRARAPTIDSSGAIGRNIGSYYFVSEQRDAVWTMLSGFLDSDTTKIDSAVKAMEYAFGQMSTDGSWSGAPDLPSQEEGTAFFLATFGRIYLGIYHSSYWSTYSSRLTALGTSYTTSMSWFNGIASDLYSADQTASNRCFFDGVAYGSGAIILSNATYNSTANSFLSKGLANQDSTGWFSEHYTDPNNVTHTGYDVSYQGTSLLNGFVIATYAGGTYITTVIPACNKGATWELPFVNSNGSLNFGESVRVGIEPSPTNGLPKTANYPEDCLGMVYSYAWDGNHDKLAAADRMANFAVNGAAVNAATNQNWPFWLF